MCYSNRFSSSVIFLRMSTPVLHVKTKTKNKRADRRQLLVNLTRFCKHTRLMCYSLFSSPPLHCIRVYQFVDPDQLDLLCLAAAVILLVPAHADLRGQRGRLLGRGQRQEGQKRHSNQPAGLGTDTHV